MSQEKKAMTQERIALPTGVSADFKEGMLTIKKGAISVSKKLNDPKVPITIERDTIIVATDDTTKNGKRMVNTYAAHVNNLIKGVAEGFTYKLKVCSGHFPMTVKIESDRCVVSNFLGEKIPRVSKIHSEAKVKLEKETITITSSNKEAAGQTAANIERSTFIRGRDRRLFQDGIYITEKPHVKYI